MGKTDDPTDDNSYAVVLVRHPGTSVETDPDFLVPAPPSIALAGDVLDWPMVSPDDWPKMSGDDWKPSPTLLDHVTQRIRGVTREQVLEKISVVAAIAADPAKLDVPVAVANYALVVVQLSGLSRDGLSRVGRRLGIGLWLASEFGPPVLDFVSRYPAERGVDPVEHLSQWLPDELVDDAGALTQWLDGLEDDIRRGQKEGKRFIDGLNDELRRRRGAPRATVFTVNLEKHPGLRERLLSRHRAGELDFAGLPEADSGLQGVLKIGGVYARSTFEGGRDRLCAAPLEFDGSIGRPLAIVVVDVSGPAGQGRNERPLTAGGPGRGGGYASDEIRIRNLHRVEVPRWRPEVAGSGWRVAVASRERNPASTSRGPFRFSLSRRYNPATSFATKVAFDITSDDSLPPQLLTGELLQRTETEQRGPVTANAPFPAQAGAGGDRFEALDAYLRRLRSVQTKAQSYRATHGVYDPTKIEDAYNERVEALRLTGIDEDLAVPFWITVNARELQREHSIDARVTWLRTLLRDQDHEFRKLVAGTFAPDDRLTFLVEPLLVHVDKKDYVHEDYLAQATIDVRPTHVFGSGAMADHPLLLPLITFGRSFSIGGSSDVARTWGEVRPEVGSLDMSTLGTAHMRGFPSVVAVLRRGRGENSSFVQIHSTVKGPDPRSARLDPNVLQTTTKFFLDPPR